MQKGKGSPSRGEGPTFVCKKVPNTQLLLDDCYVPTFIIISWMRCKKPATVVVVVVAVAYLRLL